MYGLEMAKGLVVTFGNLLRKPFTTSYPEQRVRPASPVPGRGVRLVRGTLHRLRLLRQVLPPGDYQNRNRAQRNGAAPGRQVPAGDL